jgi:hypothetical protein
MLHKLCEEDLLKKISGRSKRTTPWQTILGNKTRRALCFLLVKKWFTGPGIRPDQNW